MSRTVAITEAERNLRGILHSLEQGESATVLDEKRRPLATLTSLKPNRIENEKEAREKAVAEWVEGMKKLGKEIDAAWISEKGAVETVSEMRGRLD